MNWVRTSPSLALVKYWGKKSGRMNRPATPSLAVGVEELHSYCRAEITKKGGTADQVILNGTLQKKERFSPFFDYLRRDTKKRDLSFQVESWNDFPTAAGFASSSSGFAAMALACGKAINRESEKDRCSRWAGRGSASASRAVWGGFTRLPAGALQAQPLYPSSYWPDLRLILVQTSGSEKPLSSREAMERCRKQSPGYSRWLRESRSIYSHAEKALDRQDLEELGHWMQQSYMGMFSLMFTLPRPIIYWLPESLELIRLCAELRQRGIQAWETVDAGPQVKILTTREDLPAILADWKNRELSCLNRIRISTIGGDPSLDEDLPGDLKR